MRLGFMIYSLHRSLADGSLTVPGALRLMKELGAEGVDITADHVSGYRTAEVAQMVADAGLIVSCYIAHADQMGDEGPAAQAALDAGRRLLDTAAQLGTRTALIITGDCKPDQDRAEGRAIVGHRLGALLPHARDNNVVLTIESRGSLQSPYQTGAECLEVCEIAGPDMMLAYDDGNMILGDEDPVHFLNVAGSRVAHAHAKDWMALPPDAQKGISSRAGKRVIGTVVGQGILDYPRILAALKAIGYQEFLSFEYEGERDPVEAAREGMAYLRDNLTP